jgi:hypothetical protein
MKSFLFLQGDGCLEPTYEAVAMKTRSELGAKNAKNIKKR